MSRKSSSQEPQVINQKPQWWAISLYFSVRETHEVTKTVPAIVLAVACPPGIGGKTLLLKVLNTLAQKSSWNLANSFKFQGSFHSLRRC